MATYDVAFAAGGQPKAHLNRLSLDGQNSIVFFNNHISIYSLQSRLPIRSFNNINVPSLPFDAIVDTFVSPVNSKLVYLLTKSSVYILNWYDNIKEPLISEINLQSKIQKDGDATESNIEYVQIINFQVKTETKINILAKEGKNTYHILSYDLDENKVSSNLATYEDIALYSISNNFKNIAFLVKRSMSTSTVQFHVFSFGDDNNSELAKYSFTHALTYSKSNVVKIAISNDQADPMLAFALTTGLIILMFDLTSEKPPLKNLKWHMDPVRALSFNHDSTYVMSGGSEKVLVFWNIMNEKQQFLPRLNGPIENIQLNSNIPTLINLSLSVIDNDTQYLVLNTTDLLTKLDINTPHVLAGLNDETTNSLKKNVNRDINAYLKTKSKANPQYSKFKHNYNLQFRINPKSNHLYLPAGRHLQMYDHLHDNQVGNLAVVQAIQQYGKVGAEHKIHDPIVVGFDFVQCAKTKERDWLVTCDVEVRGEAEDLSNASIERWETLKFWKYNSVGPISESDNVSISDSWSLQTKILTPHGDSPITAIVPAPASYFGGEAVLTADAAGNVRLWRPNSQGIWSLRKFYLGGAEHNDNGSPASATTSKKQFNMTNIANNEGTSCAWCPDSSMIAVGRNGKVMLLDVNTFEPIHTVKPAISASRFHTHASITDENDGSDSTTQNTSAQEQNGNGHCPPRPFSDANYGKQTRYLDLNVQNSHIQSVNFTSNGKLLVVETRTHLTVLDVLKNKVVFGMVFSNENLTSGFGGSFIRLVSRSKDELETNDQSGDDLHDYTTDELMVVSKYFDKNTSKINSKITLWNISDKKSTVVCKWCYHYDGSIIGAEWSETWQKWIMADMDSNLGEIGHGKSYSRSKLLKDVASKEHESNWIVSSLLDNARIINRAISTSAAKKAVSGSDEFNDRVGLQNSTFDGVLDHLDGVSPETLFERVLRVV